MKQKTITLSAIVLSWVFIIGITGCYDFGGKWGCMDPNADNYDEKAKNDDGACMYDSYLANIDQKAYDAADGIKGGKLYYAFFDYVETAWTVPQNITKTDITNYSEFYRCMQCHGWDLTGNTGTYNDRAPNSSRPDVARSIRDHAFSNSPMRIRETFDAIKNPGGRRVDVSLTQDGTNGKGNPHPDYGYILQDQEIWDIVKFLREEAFDCTQLYDFTPSGSYPGGGYSIANLGLDGNANDGYSWYTANCGSCHGANGTDYDLSGKTLGSYVRGGPYQIQHRIKFGYLCNKISFPEITLTEVKDFFKALADTSQFPN